MQMAKEKEADEKAKLNMELIKTKIQFWLYIYKPAL
jgi:hypothetical protein